MVPFSVSLASNLTSEEQILIHANSALYLLFPQVSIFLSRTQGAFPILWQRYAWFQEIFNVMQYRVLVALSSVDLVLLNQFQHFHIMAGLSVS